MYKMEMSKKAAIGATMTWVVATIVILVVMIFFIYASWVLGKQEGFLDFEKLVQRNQVSNTEAEQTLLALLQTKINDKTVEDYILENKYNEVEDKVKIILDKLDLEHLEAEVYIGDKRIVLDEDEMEVG